MATTVYSLHKVPICHRDIKPDNFLVKGENPNLSIEDNIKNNTIQLKLGDFGSAKQVKKADSNYTYQRGTMQFMPPEILTSDFEQGNHLI